MSDEKQRELCTLPEIASACAGAPTSLCLRCGFSAAEHRRRIDDGLRQDPATGLWHSGAPARPQEPPTREPVPDDRRRQKREWMRAYRARQKAAMETAEAEGPAKGEPGPRPTANVPGDAKRRASVPKGERGVEV